MAAVIYSLEDGSLYRAFGEDDPYIVERDGSKTYLIAPADVLQAKGYGCKRGLPKLDATHVWDKLLLDVVERAVPVQRFIPTSSFVLAFTPAEFERVMSSEDVVLRQFVFALNVAGEIEVTGATVKRGLAYLVQLGIITQERADAIATLGA